MSESTPFGCALCVLCNHTVAITDGQLLRCGHAFHHECFTKWVSKRKTCPTCREPFHLISNLYPSAGSKCSQFKQPVTLPSTGLISEAMYSTQRRRQYLADLDSSLHVDQVELRDLFTMVKQSMILSRKLYFEGRFELSFRAMVRCRFLFFKMQARPQFNLFEKCNAGEVKTCEMALRVVDSAFGEAVDNLLKFHDRNVVDGCLSQQMHAQWQSLNPPDKQ